jgi:hypothetical protein
MRFPVSALRLAAICPVFCLSVLPVVCQSQASASKDAQTVQASPETQRIQNGVQLKTGDLNVKV